VSATGSVLSAFDFSLLSSSAEGVTIDNDGIIYVVDESPPSMCSRRFRCLQPFGCSARACSAPPRVPPRGAVRAQTV